MTKILIDTCVWENLAKYKANEKLLNILEEFIEAKYVSLILPQIIIDEFQRSKVRAIKESNLQNIQTSIKTLKGIAKQISDPDKKESVLTQLDDLANRGPAIEAQATQSINRIETLFKNAEIIKIGNEVKLAVFQKAIDKKAPFHNGKNNMADGLIIESFINYKEKNKTEGINFIFVSNNKKEFSSMKGKETEPHEDFANVFDSFQSQYFIRLHDALMSIDSELVGQIEFVNFYQEDLRTFTEMVEVAEELFEKIWYNRYLNRKYKTVIKKIEDQNIENPDMESMLLNLPDVGDQPARKIEEKYGKKNLRWDDFEWGMINGKLSAIRWVLGEEWDFLDT